LEQKMRAKVRGEKKKIGVRSKEQKKKNGAMDA
jgi:hypothetical protein